MTGRMLLGRYELGREIGAGATGRVYEGTDRQLERKVAIKLLSSGHHSSETRARFVREAKLLARIQSQHVVAVFDVGVSSSEEPFIVMELLAGGTLRQRIAEQRVIPPVQAAMFARDLSRGLCALHAAGLVHRDVKPANAVITAAGDREIVKLLDLGVARAADEATLSEPGAVVGTVLYIAPEQIRGGEVDGRADIYALGVTLFEMLEGRPPFTGPTAVETIHAHLYDAPRKAGGHVPRVLADLVARCLAKRPEDRFATADQLEAALCLAASTEPAAELAVVVPMPVLPELLGGVDQRATAVAPPDVPSPVDVPEQSAEGVPHAPLELQIDSRPHAVAAPPPSVDTGSDPFDAVLEVNRDGPVHTSSIGRPGSSAPSAHLLAQPELSSMPHPVMTAPAPSALSGVFAVFPAELHRRLAIVAFIMAWPVLLLLNSWLLFGLCMSVSAFGWAGYLMRRRPDGLDE